MAKQTVSEVVNHYLPFGRGFSSFDTKATAIQTKTKIISFAVVES